PSDSLASCFSSNCASMFAIAALIPSCSYSFYPYKPATDRGGAASLSLPPAPFATPLFRGDGRRAAHQEQYAHSIEVVLYTADILKVQKNRYFQRNFLPCAW